MATFSDRFGYIDPDPKSITEDAPMWLRTSFLEEVLTHFIQEEIFMGDLPYDEAIENFANFVRILSNELHRDFQQLISSNYPEDNGYVLSHWKSYLEVILREITWNEFYDLVEFVGRFFIRRWDEFAEMGSDPNDDISRDIALEYSFKYSEYQEDVNNFFEKNNVRWRLDQESELQLLFPDELMRQRDDNVDQLIKDGLKTTLTYYRKAERFITHRPLDPQNSIKEIVDAIEALGTVYYPNTKKLVIGQLINLMGSSGKYPGYIIDIMKYFAAYTNSEARHGVEKEIIVKLVDGEFCFHLGTAIMRYIRAIENTQANSE